MKKLDTLPPVFAAVRRRYPQIVAIVSPPRCSSTALARVFWEHPEVRFYCHEPFEVTYYDGRDLTAVVAKLEAPLDLERLKGRLGAPGGSALVIKEMPYQVGAHFPLLAELATRPIVFLLRDPRLNISSRMAKKREVGDEALYPRIESGWDLLARQVDWCRGNGVPHRLVETTELRRAPLEVLPTLFEQLGMTFHDEMLELRACPQVELDNLGGRHRHLYGEVLASSGIRPDTTAVPPLESFPSEHGWRDHVERCLAIYHELLDRPERVRLAAAFSRS